MVRALLPTLSLFAALPAAAQEMTNPCDTGKVECRMVETIRIQEPDGDVVQLDVHMRFPWVADGNIILTPGDSVTVKLVPDGDILSPVLVRFGPASASAKPGPGEIRFTMAPSDKGQQMMTAESNYPGMIDYGALMALATTGEAHRTSVCTLQPGVPVFEMWTDPIYQMALMHFVPTKEPGCKTLQWGEEAQLVKKAD